MGSCMLVAGPIWSGKTAFVIRMLDGAHILFDTLPPFVFWFYGQKTAQHDLLTKKNYIMHEGLPENFDFCEPNSVIVLDDLMEETKDRITDLILCLTFCKMYTFSQSSSAVGI